MTLYSLLSLVTCIFYHIAYSFLNLQLIFCSFIFTKVAWKLGFLRWLNAAQKKFRGHTFDFNSGCFYQLYIKDMNCMSRGTAQGHRAKISRHYVSFMWLIGHSRSSKITVESPNRYFQKLPPGGVFNKRWVFWKYIANLQENTHAKAWSQ